MAQVTADETVEVIEIRVERTGDMVLREARILSVGGVERARATELRRIEIERDVSGEPDARVREIGQFLRGRADNLPKPPPVTRLPRP